MTPQATSDHSFYRIMAWKNKITKKVFDILNSIETIPSQNERIKLVMDKLFDGKNNESNAILDYVMDTPELKNAGIGKLHKDAAHEFYVANLKVDAIINLTQAVAFALPNTELLSAVYNDRSKILYDYGMFESCLEDMERVFLPYLSKNEKIYFYHRKATCHRQISAKLSTQVVINKSSEHAKSNVKVIDQIFKLYNNQFDDVPIDRGNDVRYSPPLPILKNKNALIPGLSDAVELNFTEDLGRHIIAARDISPGELIGICKTHATAISWVEKVSFCWHCSKDVCNAISCERCPNVFYCSEYCREKSFEAYHDIECSVLSYLEKHESDDLLIMTLRITINAYKECGSQIDKLMYKYDINATAPTKDELFKGDHDPNKYSSIHMLSRDYNPSRNGYNSICFTNSWIIAYYLSITIGLIKRDKPLSELKKCDKFIYLLGFIERTMRIVSLNRVVCQYRDGLKRLEDIILAVKITPGSMHFKQQCYTDILRIHQDDHELIYTLIGIKKGGIIGDNYLLNHHEKNIEARRAAVKSMFGYDCNCNACMKDSKTTPVNKKDLEKIKNDISNVEKKVIIISNLASDYFRKHEKIYDATVYVNNLIEIIKNCQKILKPNSAVLKKAQSVLAQALDLSQVPYISVQ